MLSLYIPSDKSREDIYSRLQSEVAEAQNIKSDTTRDRVINALQYAQNELANVDEIPDSGMVIFTGEANGGEITVRKTIVDDEIQIDSFRYICDTEFHTEHIALLGDPLAVVVAFELGTAIIGTVTEHAIQYVDTVTQTIPPKHKKGGQSAQRFSRRRDESVKEFQSVVGDRLSDFSGVDTLLIGGPDISIDNFRSSGSIPHWFDTIHTVSAQISGEESLSRIVEQLDDRIGVTDSKSEYFFEQLRSNKAVYGSDAVAKALQYNAVETLYVIGDDISEGVIELTEQQGGDVIYHEQITEPDERLAMMADIAATLRYDIGE